MPETLSADCQDLIRGMLTVNVDRRMKMDQIMAHRWVMDGYSMLKATSIYQVGLQFNIEANLYVCQRDVFDQDILIEMAMNQRQSPATLLEELKKVGPIQSSLDVTAFSGTSTITLRLISLFYTRKKIMGRVYCQLLTRYVDPSFAGLISLLEGRHLQFTYFARLTRKELTCMWFDQERSGGKGSPSVHT